MGSTAGPRGLQAEHKWSRDRAAFAASLALPGVLLTHSSPKHFRLYFAKLFPVFFFLQVTAKWKSLSLPKLQALSSLLKTQIFFSLCNFLLHNCRKRLLQCSARGFQAQGKDLPIQLPATRARRCSFGSNTWSRQTLPVQHHPGAFPPAQPGCSSR